MKCLIFVAFLLTVHITYGAQILAIFPLCVTSHFAMFERLMKGLAERGHEVDVVSHFPQKRAIPRYTLKFTNKVAF